MLKRTRLGALQAGDRFYWSQKQGSVKRVIKAYTNFDSQLGELFWTVDSSNYAFCIDDNEREQEVWQILPDKTLEDLDDGTVFRVKNRDEICMKSQRQDTFGIGNILCWVLKDHRAIWFASNSMVAEIYDYPTE